MISDRAVFLSVIAVCAIVGCTTITQQVEGFPQDLEITVHEDAPYSTIFAKCYPSIPLWQKLIGSVPIRCAWIDLHARTCTIYGKASKHELAHCKGGDHDGLLQAYFDQYRGIK